MKIIDFHCHLGDILDPHGGRIITKHNLRRLHPLDPDAVNRAVAYRSRWMGSLVDKTFLSRIVSAAERKRNRMASADNLLYYMDQHKVSTSVIMPIAPNVTYSSVARVCDGQRLMAFGSIDFTRDDLEEQAIKQIGRGVLGFKIHPILQRVDMIGRAVERVMDVCPDGMMILLHTGFASYYSRRKRDQQRIEFGAVHDLFQLANHYRNLRFIAGHAGLREFNDVLLELTSLEHVYVDISFQSPQHIRLLLDRMGYERVLYASDWPYGFHAPAIRAVQYAVKTTRETEHVFYQNAQRLLQLDKES